MTLYTSFRINRFASALTLVTLNLAAGAARAEEPLLSFTHVARIPAGSDTGSIRFEKAKMVRIPTTVAYAGDSQYCSEIAFRIRVVPCIAPLRLLEIPLRPMNPHFPLSVPRWLPTSPGIGILKTSPSPPITSPSASTPCPYGLGWHPPTSRTPPATDRRFCSAMAERVDSEDRWGGWAARLDFTAPPLAPVAPGWQH